MNKPFATTPRTGRTWPDSSMCQTQIDSKVYSAFPLSTTNYSQYIHESIDAWEPRYTINNNKSTDLYLFLFTNKQVTPSQTKPKSNPNSNSQCNTPSTSKSLNSHSFTEPDSSGCLPPFTSPPPEQTWSSCLALPCLVLVLVQPVLCIVSSCLISPQMSLVDLPYLTPDQIQPESRLTLLTTKRQHRRLYMQGVC